MKKRPEETLLHDVLREASSSFRQELLEASLKELRRTRRGTKRSLGLPLAIAAAFVLGVGLLFIAFAHRAKNGDLARAPGNLPTAPAATYAPMEIVTKEAPGMAIVESRQYQSLVVQNSSIQLPVEIVGDTELLALFPDKAAGLIANSHGAFQFLLLNSQDQIFRP